MSDLEERVARLEKAVVTVAWWLAQTPGVWGVQDARGIEKILEAPHPKPVPAEPEG